MKAYVLNFFAAILFGIAVIALILSPLWGIRFDIFHGLALTICIFLFFLFWWASTVPVSRFHAPTLPYDLLEEENVGDMLKIGTSPIDVTVVFAYGKGEKMNAALGTWAENIVNKFGSPIGMNLYTQRDMAPFLNIRKGVVFAHEGEKYLSTYGIVRQFLEVFRDRGYHRVAVVATPQHIKRCVRDLYAEGFECYVDRDEFFAPIEVKRSFGLFPWYNPDDPQDQVRSHKNWWRRERILRILPFVLYKILTR